MKPPYIPPEIISKGGNPERHRLYQSIYGSPKIKALSPSQTVLLLAWGLTWILACSSVTENF